MIINWNKSAAFHLARAHIASLLVAPGSHQSNLQAVQIVHSESDGHATVERARAGTQFPVVSMGGICLCAQQHFALAAAELRQPNRAGTPGLCITSDTCAAFEAESLSPVDRDIGVRRLE